jgi:tetratricopeptide (TPR) repeat protein
MGIQLIEEGELSEAEALLNTSLTDAESARDETMISDVNNCLGILASFQGRVDLAMVHYARSLVSSQTLGDSQRAGFAHYNLGLVLREWGQPRAALDHFNRAEEFFEVKGTAEERLHVKSERSLLTLDLGDPELAEYLARNALSESAEIQAPVLRAAALRSLASILICRRSFDEALSLLRSALHLMGEARGGLVKAEIYEELALLYTTLNDPALANRYRAAAEREYGRLGSRNHINRLNRRVQSVKPS